MGERLEFGGVRSGSQLTVDFMLVDVRQQLIQEAVGPFEFDEVIGGEQGREAFLPIIMAALDFTFGLGRGGVTEGYPVEVQRRAELGEGVWGVGEEE